MKVNYKINTLRGIFFGLQWYERPALPSHGFARKELAYFYASFRFFGWPYFTSQNQDRPRSSPLQKGEHFPFTPETIWPGILKIIFEREQK
jgi:hypothetical protein